MANWDTRVKEEQCYVSFYSSHTNCVAANSCKKIEETEQSVQRVNMLNNQNKLVEKTFFCPAGHSVSEEFNKDSQCEDRLRECNDVLLFNPKPQQAMPYTTLGGYREKHTSR